MKRDSKLLGLLAVVSLTPDLWRVTILFVQTYLFCLRLERNFKGVQAQTQNLKLVYIVIDLKTTKVDI